MPDLPITKTSIDLELDLAAQQSKLSVLNEEIERLKQIKAKMEEARDNCNSELPAWFHEDEKFQSLLASVSFDSFSLLFFSSIHSHSNMTFTHSFCSWSSRKDKKALRRKKLRSC